jgi:hypothetical protein
LAQKQGSSSGVDVVDVQYVLAAFEEINKCKLEITIWLQGTAARPEVWLEMRAWEPEVDRMAVLPLGSQKQRIGSSGPRSMEAAILQGMYALDAQLAAEEFAKVHKK